MPNSSHLYTYRMACAAYCFPLCPDPRCTGFLDDSDLRILVIFDNVFPLFDQRTRSLEQRLIYTLKQVVEAKLAL